MDASVSLAVLDTTLIALISNQWENKKLKQSFITPEGLCSSHPWAVPLCFLIVVLIFFLMMQEMQENVKKCKNFLATLIKLASHNSPSPETSKNVKALVQDLLVST